KYVAASQYGWTHAIRIARVRRCPLETRKARTCAVCCKRIRATDLLAMLVGVADRADVALRIRVARTGIGTGAASAYSGRAVLRDVANFAVRHEAVAEPLASDTGAAVAGPAFRVLCTDGAVWKKVVLISADSVDAQAEEAILRDLA